MIVTGAASGIGASTLERFRDEGADAVGFDITPADGLISCDVTDPAWVDAAMAAAVDQLGGLDVAVNVAGTGGFSLIGDMDPDFWNQVLAVNLTGPMLITRAALPHLRESTGNIVTVASISGMQGQPYLSAYCASKGGLLLFMKSIAAELAAEGIRVNCVCPGGVGEMPSADAATDILPPGVDPMMFLRLNGVLPGVTEQADIADAIAYLASDSARSISGAALLVDRVTIW